MLNILIETHSRKKICHYNQAKDSETEKALGECLNCKTQQVCCSMEKGANFHSICYKTLGHQLCFSLAASPLRPDSLISLAMAIVPLIAAETGISSIFFQHLVQQTPYLGPAVSSSSLLWNYLCQFKNNTVCNRMITLLYKWGYKVQGSTDLFQAIRTALSSMDDNFFYVSWRQDQTINFCHLCAACSLSQNFDYRL